MKTLELKIAQISTRGNKFAIMAGKSVLAKYKTADQAKLALVSDREELEYWACSAGVSIQNTPSVIRYL